MGNWRRARAAVRAVAAAVAAWAVCAALPAGAPERASGPATRPDPSRAAQGRMYFPDDTRDVRTFRAGGVVLWTDAPVDGAVLLGDMRAAEAFLSDVLPPPASRPAAGGAATRPVALAVYARRSDYQALWQRVGRHYGGRFGRIETEGYSYRVCCATYRGSATSFAARRPVLCHEFAHVWLYQRHGLANAVQLRLFPDSGDRGDFARWMEEGRMLPLKRLMDGGRVRPKDYWQAATLAEVLIADYRRRLPAVLAAYNRGDSTYLIVSEALGTDFAALTRRWAAHVRSGARPGRRPTPPRGPAPPP